MRAIRSTRIFPEPSRLHLFLDYDGTLSPIRPRPGQAFLDPRLRTLLKSLAARDDLRVCVISGRALDDLRRRVRVPGVTLVGIHGAEIQEPGRRLRTFYRVSDVRRIRRLQAGLEARLGFLPGIEFENKGPILAVHYRRTAPRRHSWVHRECRKAVPAGLVLRFGKKVIEFRAPRLPHKGEAVRRLLRRGWTPVAIGDDWTDRDMFRAVRRRGISIAVGRRDLGADLVLRGPDAVARLLRQIP